MLFESIKSYISTLSIGDRLPNELAMAEKFGVSRGTIREIISHLCLLNILERTPKRGTFVKAPEVADISETLAFQLQVAKIGFEELKAMRLFLEISQIPLIIKLATPMAIDNLKYLVDQMDELTDKPEEADVCDLQFHLALVEISGNRILTIFSSVINLLFEQKYRGKFLTPKAVKKSVNDHRNMIKYIRNGDVENLKILVAEHINPI